MSTIGQILKEAREAKNVSIEEAQRVTKIQLNILASLEQDAFDNLPNPTYIRGFIKQYAQYLGLDPEPLLKEYSSLNVKPPEQEIVVKSKDDELKSSQPVKPKVPVGKKKNNSIVIISIAAVSVLIIAGLFFFVMSGKESPQEGVSSKKEPSKPLLVKRNRPLKLTIFANKDSWMHIKCDGNIVYQNIPGGYPGLADRSAAHNG